MDSLSEGTENQSVAKRLKLDPNSVSAGVMCDDSYISNNFATSAADIGGMKENPPNTTSSPHPPNSSASDLNTSTDMTHNLVETQPYATSLESLHDSFELEQDDDNMSTISNLSDLSGFSGKDWKPMAGRLVWIQKQMRNGVNPRILLNELGANSDRIPQQVDDVTLWKLIINILAEPPPRHKLRNVNAITDVLRLLKSAKNIIVLTGAGVSVSCGIPDFRSRDGIYLRLAVDFPNLPDPQAMFDINYFNRDPRPFYKFAKDIYPGNFKPSPCHRFIKLLEKHSKLLRNYTQNIDTLEKVAGIEKVVECHGSFSTATCTKCGYQVTADAIRDTIVNQKIPLCEKCHGDVPAFLHPDDVKSEDLHTLTSSGIMKPDIVFFGEGLPSIFHTAMAEDKSSCDLLLVMGSSLKVRPVALIPSSLPPEVPQILINREPLPHCNFDVELLGDCDIIINHICQQLDEAWQECIYTKKKLNETIHLLPIVKETENPLIANESGLLTSFFTDDLKSSCIFDLGDRNSPVAKHNEDSYVHSEESMSVVDKSFVLPEDDVTKSESKSLKERHMSVDSARDSGIGENSNFTDDKFEVSDETTSDNHSYGGDNSKFVLDKRRNITDRLPPNTFYLLPPSRYVFPGAEIYDDPNERYTYFDDDTSSSDTTDSESETDNNF